jgi:hypothetical protein
MLRNEANKAKRRPAGGHETVDTDDNSEYEEDEYGNKCSTYTQIEIYSNDRVITLKKLVESRFGIGLDDQILVYKDKVIKSDLKQLAALNVRQFARVHVFDKRDLKTDQDEMDLLSRANLYGIYQNCNKTAGLNADNAASASGSSNAPTTSADASKIIKTRPPPMPPILQSGGSRAATADRSYNESTGTRDHQSNNNNTVRRKYSTLDRTYDRESGSISSYRRPGTREETKKSYMPNARDTVDFYNRGGYALPQRADSVRYQYQQQQQQYNNFADESLSYRKY